MSIHDPDDHKRLEREEAEVREALLGDAGVRTTEWLFAQIGDIGTSRASTPTAGDLS